MSFLNHSIAVVIPTYKCKAQIERVINKIPDFVDIIYIVDDKCPQETGKHVENIYRDNPRIKVIFRPINGGVGSATKTGYIACFENKIDIAIKIDGDDQMNPLLIPQFIRPICEGYADYTKGNRFTKIENMRKMPRIRIFGNLGLSFITKLSSGYWKIMDPTNGYTAISVRVLNLLDLEKISNRYFFESDMLFRLNLSQARIKDIPIPSKYEDEVSNLHIRQIFFDFLSKHLKNFSKRIFYQYFLLDFNIASIELLLGSFLLLFGMIHGTSTWIHSYLTQGSAPTGTIMLSTLPIILGVQFLLSFINYDIAKEPQEAIHRWMDE